MRTEDARDAGGSPRPSIRPATPDDTDALVAIWLAASRESHSFVPYDVWLSHADAMRDVYLPAAQTFVAVDSDGRVIGFMSLVGDELAALFVEPSSQGRGIGTALLGHAQQVRSILTLGVYAANARAIAFYRGHGFDLLNERIDEKTGQPEMRMRWSAIA